MKASIPLALLPLIFGFCMAGFTNKKEALASLMTKCHFKSSFLNHGNANRFEISADIPLPGSNLQEARDFWRRTEDPKDPIFWPKLYMNHLTKFDENANIIRSKDDKQVHRLVNFQRSGDCVISEYSTEWLNQDKAAKADAVAIFHAKTDEQGVEKYYSRVTYFNCHLNKRDPSEEERVCGDIHQLWRRLDDNVNKCLFMNAKNPEDCKED